MGVGVLRVAVTGARMAEERSAPGRDAADVEFAAGFLQQPAPDLLVRLAEHEVSSAKRLEAATAASAVVCTSVTSRSILTLAR